MPIRTTRLMLVTILLTTLVFIAGVLLGWGLEQYKSATILGEIKQSEIELDSFFSTQMLIDSLGGGRCQLLGEQISILQKNTHELGKALNRYEATKTFSLSEFDNLKRKYFISEIRFFSLLNTLNKECGTNYSTLIFFYKVHDTASTAQGEILDALYAEHGSNLVVFSFDIDYKKEPAIPLLLKKYSVSSAPALVINGADVRTGLTRTEELELALSNSTQKI